MMFPKATPQKSYTDAIRVIENRVNWLRAYDDGRTDDIADDWYNWADCANQPRACRNLHGLTHVLAMARYGLPLSYEPSSEEQEVYDLLQSALRYARVLEKTGDDMDMLYARWTLCPDGVLKGSLRDAKRIGAYDPLVPAPALLRRCVSEWATSEAIAEYQDAAAADERLYQEAVD